MCYSAPIDRTCPTVERSNEENCVDECTSHNQCQYDRICCDNGCGGHTCSDSVETCQVRPVSITAMWLLLCFKSKPFYYK